MTALTAAEVAAARLALAAADPLMARAHAAAPPFEWRSRGRGFPGLVKMVVEQQVSVAAAEAIWKRIETGLGGAVTPEAVLAFEAEALKAFGLSIQKARYARAIAEAEALFHDMETLPDAEAVARLTAIKGVGRWTAEVYLMFCEGRRDVFPAGDMALQEGVRLLGGAAARPSEKALYALSQAWAPHRSTAALMVWACYTGVRKGTIDPARLATEGADA